MKQLLINDNGLMMSGGTPKDLTCLQPGQICFWHLDDDTAFLEDDSTVFKNFAIALGRATANPIVIPEVDFSSLTVVKSEYQEGTTFYAQISIPTPTPGSEYTIILVKKGAVLNERNKWTFTALAKNNSTEQKIAEELVKQINASSETSEVTAVLDDDCVNISGSEIGVDYEIVLADELIGLDFDIDHAEPEILGKKYMKELASQCAAGKGFNYTAEDVHELYPGYPEEITKDEWDLYTLRFKVGRSGAHQRDEQVYQIVHIAVPTGDGSLDTILGTENSDDEFLPTPSVSDGD